MPIRFSEEVGLKVSPSVAELRYVWDCIYQKTKSLPWAPMVASYLPRRILPQHYWVYSCARMVYEQSYGNGGGGMGSVGNLSTVNAQGWILVNSREAARLFQVGCIFHVARHRITNAYSSEMRRCFLPPSFVRFFLPDGANRKRKEGGGR